jgi:hypothetical protein
MIRFDEAYWGYGLSGGFYRSPSTNYSLSADHFLPGFVKPLTVCFGEEYSGGFGLGGGYCGIPDVNYPLFADHFLPAFYPAPHVNSVLQEAAVLHDAGDMFFTTNYDRVFDNLSSLSPWKGADRAEVLIDTLRSKVNSFKTAIASFWSWTNVLDGSGHRIFSDPQEMDQWIVGPETASTWNPLFTVTSYVAKVVSKAQLLVDKLTKRISRLVRLRVCFIAPQEQATISRTVVERRFFCIHGFHPPDLELPQNIFGLVFTGYVPGLLSI